MVGASFLVFSVWCNIIKYYFIKVGVLLFNTNIS